MVSVGKYSLPYFYLFLRVTFNFFTLISEVLEGSRDKLSCSTEFFN